MKRISLFLISRPLKMKIYTRIKIPDNGKPSQSRKIFLSQKDSNFFQLFIFFLKLKAAANSTLIPSLKLLKSR
jgi:hypothetical protein